MSGILNRVNFSRQGTILGIAGVLAIVLLFASCDMPIGMGKTIDFEPPVLTMNNVPNPFYVNTSVVISGTVSDNTGVRRVICRDVLTQEQIGEDAILSNRRVVGGRVEYDWSISITFTDEDNNRKISAEVIAWDTIGNSGEGSIAYVTFIVDTRPPIFETPFIQRSISRSAPLQDLSFFKALEVSDNTGACGRRRF
jgi:hypothetical protein